jgi:hypothetical protein
MATPHRSVLRLVALIVASAAFGGCAARASYMYEEPVVYETRPAARVYVTPPVYRYTPPVRQYYVAPRAYARPPVHHAPSRTYRAPAVHRHDHESRHHEREHHHHH